MSYPLPPYPLPSVQLSRQAAERYAQLSALAESQPKPAREPRAVRLVRLVRAKLA